MGSPPKALTQITPVKGRRRHLRKALKHVSLQGPWLEFGVHKGSTARYLLEELPADGQLHLFDSFKGLPVAWDSSHPKGRFALSPQEIPAFEDGRITMWEGWFDKAIPRYLEKNSDPVALVHIDSDVYISAKHVLDGIGHLITPGALLIFDELFGYQDWEKGEYKAFSEFIEKYKLQFKYLTRAFRHQVGIKILKNS